MADKTESDQTLTTPGSITTEQLPTNLPGDEEEKKAKSGLFGIVALLSGLVLLLVALFNSFGDSGQFHLDSNTDLTINLKMSSQQFLVVSEKNVCDGIGDYPGIRTSQAIIKSGSIDKKVQIGSGQLNDQGQCEYFITVPTPDNFKGGTVNFSFVFPFGKSDVFPINVGDSAPYKKAVVEIPLK
jgi:hypothetical protein